MNDRRQAVMVVVFAFALTLWGSSAAIAHHQADHAGGPPDQASGSGGGSDQPTEDTDSDGVANEPDPAGDTDNQHPSGKDKHVEPGGSGNMGWASSEPDQNTTGPERDVDGRDQPGNTGGADKLDQDGNNGCGNDDDFEDDNEGLCGGKNGVNPPPPPPPPPPPKLPPPPDEQVEGGVIGESGAAGAPQPVEAGPDELAFTGPTADVVPLTLLTVWLTAIGLIFLILGRARSTR